MAVSRRGAPPDEADVARRHAVTRWQVYDWRKKLTAGALALPAETADDPMFAALDEGVDQGPPAERWTIGSTMRGEWPSGL